MSNVIRLPVGGDHTIHICTDPFTSGWFVVNVLPAPKYNALAKDFRNHKDAYGYASGLRMVLGWKIVDEAADAPKGAA